MPVEILGQQSLNVVSAPWPVGPRLLDRNVARSEGADRHTFKNQEETNSFTEWLNQAMNVRTYST